MYKLLERITTLEKKQKNMVQYGIIKEVDLGICKAIVSFNAEAESPSLPFLQSPNAWNPIKIGDQVIVISPSGDIEQGFIIPLIYKAGEAPSTEAEKIVLTGGTVEVTADTKIILGDGSGGGVVCKNHLCSFTGAPHPQGSSLVEAKK